jgi:acyl-CoA hydrolase
MTRLITPGHLNSNGNLFGGQLMKWMDEVAYIAATRYTKQKMVTVSVDNITFKHPVPAGSIVEVSAMVKDNNGVRLQIYTKAIAESQHDQNKSTAATAMFQFACVDPNNQPKRINKNRITGP